METPQEEIRQPITEHLEELRSRLLRSLIAFGVATALCYNFSAEIYRELLRPVTGALPADSRMIFTELTEAFLTYFKLALWGGFVLASPVIFYQVWRFVSPGLYSKERKLVVMFAFWTTLGMLAGMAFAYFIAVPSIMTFFLSFGRNVVVPMPSMKETLSLVLRLLLIFGVMFELPLVLYLAGRGGILSASFLRKWRKGAILGALLLATVLTPPDVVSQILVSVPMYALFELGILLCALGGRRREAALRAATS
ncbi:MAG: twin-arginine translocase subunit TatC [Thermodesulfobacteriota bacterium]